MQIKIKKLVDHAVLPKKAHPSDAGADLVATSINCMTDGAYISYGTGLSIEIPEGHVGLIFPRSSISKTGLSLANAVGVIDSHYRGEVSLRFRTGAGSIYSVGDRIGQLVIMPYPQIEYLEASELSETVRGSGGFGSSGS